MADHRHLHGHERSEPHVLSDRAELMSTDKPPGGNPPGVSICAGCEKHSSAAFPSFLVTAAHASVRLIARNFGTLHLSAFDSPQLSALALRNAGFVFRPL